MGVIKRERAGGRVSYQISFMVEGRQVFETVGASKREAERLYARRKKEVREGTYTGPNLEGSSVTLGAYAKRFFAKRDNRTAHDEQTRWERHIKPHLGRRRLADITARDVAAWVEALVRAGELSPKSIRNAHGVLSVLLGQAAFDGITRGNVAKSLPRGILPGARTKGAPPFSRAELETALGSPAVPPDVRILLAMMGCGGLRLGEACGRTWADLDTRSSPLWCLHVHDQYDKKPLKGDKSGLIAERWVPVHPVLQELLVDWFREGFENTLGRAPRETDPISPWPRKLTYRQQSQAGKAADKALRAAGIPKEPGRAAHSLRRSFITLTRSAGARTEDVERITHNAAGTTVDRYTWMGWPALCAAVSVLELEPRAELPAEVAVDPTRPGATGGDKLAGLKGL
jgi:integrase